MSGSSICTATHYDIDRLASAFSVSFEQVQRLTTLQRDSARGVPFFFLRVDKAGNVTKRFNATFQHRRAWRVLSGLDLHNTFRTWAFCRIRSFRW